MKLFRFVGLLVIVLALAAGATETASATAPVNCRHWCSDGTEYISQCWGTLSQCCNWMRQWCPDPYTFAGGNCTDGMNNYCP